MNNAVRSVGVSLGDRSYAIDIGAGLLGEAATRLAQLRRVTSAVVITDAHVESHAVSVVNGFADTARVDLLVVEPGESSKSIDVADWLWQKLADFGADRQTVIVAVGGGVIGDLAGFIAATYARGLALYQIPTSLLAMVDSSVGGKVGVNLPTAKNMVGAFWQPAGVLIDTDTLATLPDREYRSGLAEVVKYGVILDPEFFDFLESNAALLTQRDPETLRQVIARSCELKALVVSQDEREETGLRAVLNYGHTFCHAFETLTGYGQYLHGEAVSIGMVCAARLAQQLGRISPELGDRQRRLLTALGLPVETPQLDFDAVLKVMGRDKKVEHGRLRFVLPTRLGHVELVDHVPTEQVQAALSNAPLES